MAVLSTFLNTRETIASWSCVIREHWDYVVIQERHWGGVMPDATVNYCMIYSLKPIGISESKIFLGGLTMDEGLTYSPCVHITR